MDPLHFAFFQHVTRMFWLFLFGFLSFAPFISFYYRLQSCCELLVVKPARYVISYVYLNIHLFPLSGLLISGG